MSTWNIDTAARELLAAETERRDRGRLTDEWPELDLDTAYAVQSRLIELRAERGETVIGVKLGLTSEAKQRRMGVDAPLIAVLTDAMVLEPGAKVPLDSLIHPRIEPEIAFVMREELAGPGVTAESALSAVATVHSAFEVIDSRFRDFSFALPDVVADNASASWFIIGSEGIAPDQIDLVGETVELSVRDDVVDTATGAAIQGHPAEALALAANELGRRGERIPAGAIVLAGAMTDAVPLEPDVPVTAAYSTLGSLTVVGTSESAEGAR
ncbi:2-keto-4-pentenoate hydratase [Ruicaihuangia caeni]|uniref:4-oxalocrotonate decarboxylase n=1 Tax=Ruicaihuangia caeni TaxID=3042517 RepID=A0AAW6T9H7_9MICO|nr:4-oxalocrotonate decarboxylase [Klugiella sp. YN-L-19]MDI2099004.1 4-oxalocrotonate decarboxylase [Klugiella sp. YN-L-19]